MQEILNPQPTTADVLHELLAWIDSADRASQRCEPRPALARRDGRPLFPEGPWWLTELKQRRPEGAHDHEASDADFDPAMPSMNGGGTQSAR